MVRLRVHLLLLVVHTHTKYGAVDRFFTMWHVHRAWYIAFQTVYIYCMCTAHGLEHFVLRYSPCMYTENISQCIT